MEASEDEKISVAALCTPPPFPLADGLRYYIVRADSSMIPLVPADQLPFQVHGIPRKLNHQQISNGKWKWVAGTIETATLLSVQPPTPAALLKHHGSNTKFRAPDHKVRSERSRTVTPASSDINQAALSIRLNVSGSKFVVSLMLSFVTVTRRQRCQRLPKGCSTP